MSSDPVRPGASRSAGFETLPEVGAEPSVHFVILGNSTCQGGESLGPCPPDLLYGEVKFQRDALTRFIPTHPWSIPVTRDDIHVGVAYPAAGSAEHRTVTTIENERVFYRVAGEDGERESTLADFVTWAGEQQATLLATAQANAPDTDAAAAERERVLAASTAHAAEPASADAQTQGDAR